MKKFFAIFVWPVSDICTYGLTPNFALRLQDQARRTSCNMGQDSTAVSNPLDHFDAERCGSFNTHAATS